MRKLRLFSRPFTLISVVLSFGLARPGLARHAVGSRYLSPSVTRPSEVPNARDRSQPLQDLDLGSVPRVSAGQLQTLFQTARDSRAWSWSAMPGHARRIPWLFLEDGCFIRAQMAEKLWLSQGLPQPKTAFLFGDLHGSNRYGEYFWDFHVAPIVAVGHQPYVIDPAMESGGPLPLKDWIARISHGPEAPNMALCSGFAVHPTDDCDSTSFSIEPEEETQYVESLLESEWNLVQGSGDDPTQLLGDHPPWGP